MQYNGAFIKEDYKDFFKALDDITIVIHGLAHIDTLKEFAALFNTWQIESSKITQIIIVSNNPLRAQEAAERVDYSDYFANTQLEIADPTVFDGSIITNMAIHVIGSFAGNEGREVHDQVNRNAYSFFLIIPADNPSEQKFCGSLIGLRMTKEPVKVDDNTYCKERRDSFSKLKEKNVKSAFYQCLKEVKNPCSTCTECDNFQMKECPYFQYQLALFYLAGDFVDKNEVVGKQWLKKAIRQGYNDAEIRLAEEYQNSNEAEAIPHYVNCANKGNFFSICRLANNIETGWIAMPWVARMALNGHETQQNRIIQAYSVGGQGMAPSDREQKKWTDLALEKGNTSFMLQLAEDSARARDFEKAISWYSRLDETHPDTKYSKQIQSLFTKWCSEEQLEVERLCDLGDRYSYGVDAPLNSSLAHQCYKKAYSQGSMYAAANLGMNYLLGTGTKKNKNKGIELLKESADAGNFYGLYQLYDYYYSEDMEEAKTIRPKLCEALEQECYDGNAIGFYITGILYLNDDVYPKSEESAFNYIDIAADLGDFRAIQHLGELYLNGIGTEKDFDKAVELFQKGADRDYPAAQYFMGLCYEHGYGVKKSSRKAVGLYRKAASKSDADACYHLGLCLENGKGTEKDLKQANEWYLRGAENDNIEAAAKLSENLYHGRGIETNYPEAKRWSLFAADHGHEGSYFRAAYLCSIEKAGPTDYKKTVALYTKLIDLGKASSSVYHNLAVSYSVGEGVKKDEAKANELYFKGAESGSDYSMCTIGQRLLKGEHIEQDIERGVEWFEKGIEKNNSKCAFLLAKEYLTGEILDKDIEKSVKLYEKGASMPYNKDGNYYSEYVEKCIMALGDIYYHGDRIPCDNKKAYKYYKAAAEKGVVTAYCRLGDMYRGGDYVACDVPEAIYWFRKAAEKDNKYAQDQLRELNADWLGMPEDEPFFTDDLDWDSL